MHKRFEKKKIIVIVVAFVVVAAVVIIYRQMTSTNNNSADISNQQPLVKVEPSGVTYPEGWTELEEISASSKEQGVISEAKRSEPNAHVVVREQESSQEKPDVASLATDIADNLKKEIEGFELLDKGTVKVGSYNAAVVDYSAPSPDGSTYQNRMITVPVASKVFYVNYQTPELGAIKEDISTINKVVATYIADHKK